jgi:hypothetical protein
MNLHHGTFSIAPIKSSRYAPDAGYAGHRHAVHHAHAHHMAASGPHQGHGDHAPSLNATAWRATLHCLTGCAIGEVLGLVLGTWWGWSNGATIALAVGLAFLFGYAFTVWPLLKVGLPTGHALKLALQADTASIAVIEVVDNSVMLLIPGAMAATLDSGLFWSAMAIALAIAAVAAFPVNRWLIKRGLGHAVVHAYH